MWIHSSAMLLFYQISWANLDHNEIGSAIKTKYSHFVIDLKIMFYTTVSKIGHWRQVFEKDVLLRCFEWCARAQRVCNARADWKLNYKVGRFKLPLCQAPAFTDGVDVYDYVGDSRTVLIDERWSHSWQVCLHCRPISAIWNCHMLVLDICRFWYLLYYFQWFDIVFDATKHLAAWYSTRVFRRLLHWHRLMRSMPWQSAPKTKPAGSVVGISLRSAVTAMRFNRQQTFPPFGRLAPHTASFISIGDNNQIVARQCRLQLSPAGKIDFAVAILPSYLGNKALHRQTTLVPAFHNARSESATSGWLTSNWSRRTLATNEG